MTVILQAEMKRLHQSIISFDRINKYTYHTLEKLTKELLLRKEYFIKYFKENIEDISEHKSIIFGALKCKDYSENTTKVKEAFKKNYEEGKLLSKEISFQYLKTLIKPEINFEEHHEISAFNGIKELKVLKDFLKFKEFHKQNLIYKTNFEFAELTELIDLLWESESFNKIIILDWNNFARDLKPNEYKNFNFVASLGFYENHNF